MELADSASIHCDHIAGPSTDSSSSELQSSRPVDLKHPSCGCSSSSNVRYSPRSPSDGYGRSIAEAPSCSTASNSPRHGKRSAAGTAKRPQSACATKAKNGRCCGKICAKKYHHCPMLGVRSSNSSGSPYTCVAQQDRGGAPSKVADSAGALTLLPAATVAPPFRKAAPSQPAARGRHRSSGKAEPITASEAATSPSNATAVVAASSMHNVAGDARMRPPPPSDRALLSPAAVADNLRRPIP